MLHEVVGGDLKGLLHALTDRNGGNDHDELAPAVLPVQLEHRLDVDIGLARAGLHLNIQTAPPQAFDKGCGEPDVVLALQGLNVVQKLLVGKFDGFVSIARVVQRVNAVRSLVWDSERSLMRLRLDSATVANVTDPVVKPLPLEDAHNGVDRIGLVLLYLEIKLHLTATALSYLSKIRVELNLGKSEATILITLLLNLPAHNLMRIS